MRSAINAAYISASARMYRQADKRLTLLLVEGQDDVKVFERFVDPEKCRLVNSFGKTNVVDAIMELEEDGMQGICGIVDLDFDGMLAKEIDSENIIVTECHDLDVTLFSSPALVLYLNHAAHPEKFGALGEKRHDAVRQLVYAAGRIIGSTRFVSQREGLDLNFKNMDFASIVDLKTIQVADAWFTYIIDRSAIRYDANRLKLLVHEILATKPSDTVVCQGHDLCGILGIALRDHIGDRKGPQSYGSEVAMSLRLAFDRAAFQATKLYSDMRDWEARNAAWKLLAA